MYMYASAGGWWSFDSAFLSLSSLAYRKTLNHLSRSPLLRSDFYFFSFSSLISFPLSVGNCKNPATPTLGVRSPSGTTFQFRDVIHYSCIPGFGLVGNRTFACFGPGRSNFTGNLTCENINECVESRPCHQNAFCNDTHGSYLCSCMAGFTGNGVSCGGGYLLLFIKYKRRIFFQLIKDQPGCHQLN